MLDEGISLNHAKVRYRRRTLWFVVRRLGKLVRFVGLRRLVQIGMAHLLQGRGIKQLLIWCRDQLAFSERGNRDLYRYWVDFVEPTLPAVVSNGGDLGRVTVALGACRIEDASETLTSIERQTHPDFRLLISVPPSEFDRASSLVTSTNMQVLAGPQTTSEEDLMLFALRTAETEYGLSLLPGATLAPDALLELHRAAIDSGADLIYPDEDSVRGGIRYDPIFKPSASPDLLRGRDYVGPVCLFRLGSRLLDAHVTESSVYRLVLEHLYADTVVRRVPRMLVHWRDGRESRLSPAQVLDVADLTTPGSRHLASEPARVVASIIIPTRDRLDLLRDCISRIYASSRNLEFEVLILNNRSEEPETLRWLASAAKKWPGLEVHDADYEFNWSKLNNQGVDAAQGEVFVFLNNDVQAISEDWLETLLEDALRDEIGAVGPLLLYPDGTIQHAGIVVGIGGLADHVYAGCPTSGNDGFAFVEPLLPRNVLAVTGACMAVERRKLLEVGGFDERFGICGDIELCFRLHAAGYYNLYQPNSRLYHYESATRGRNPITPMEKDELLAEFCTLIGEEDPFYNPNLDLRCRFPTFLEPFHLD